ncbi:MAG TPA: TonB-dependent receptor [Rhizomicrobium sp.]|nr:TonB-dependent receptor [Rhizomicrobium sp.]
MFRSILLATVASTALLASIAAAAAQQTETVEDITVTAQALSAARAGIQTQLGASTYTVTSKDIQAQPGGDNSLLNSVILQMPDVAQDSYGQFHVRGEHNQLQYRINGIILPEGISVFGQTLDPRLAESIKLIDGALPAEYGLDTGGIVDITTKSGIFDTGGHVSMYGGSHNTLTPSFDYGGSVGHLNYFVSGDYTTNSLGIEAPYATHTPDHDRTKQWHGFAFLQDFIDTSSSVTAILGTSNALFEIPDTPGLQPSGQNGTVGLGPLDPGGSGNFLLQANRVNQFPGENLDDRQREITHYGTLSYLKTAGNVDFQLSAFGRYSSLFYTPGSSVGGNNLGDLLYNGISQVAYKRDIAYGTQDEGAWHLGSHTVRFGILYEADDLVSRTNSLVLPVDSGGPGSPNPNPLCTDPTQTCQTSAVPEAITDNSTKHAWSFSAYLQDEWKVLEKLTVNYGVRYDQYGAYSRGDQVSPRLNAVWTPWDGTVVHAGYSRYFSPPPIELVSNTDIALFANTTNAPAITNANTPQAERADYYDTGFTQQIGAELKVGVDSFYKKSKDLIDEGQFGAPIILTPFNYQRGRQYGLEFTADYTLGDFNAYANYAMIHAVGENWVSSQFNFSPDDLAYVMTHYINLDHESVGTASGGFSYRFSNTILSANFLIESGLRESATAPDGSNIPNGGHVPPYGIVNLGLSHDMADVGLKGLTVRGDIINVGDTNYQIRNGSGVGVFAPQYGARRGFFAGLTQAF